MSANPFQKLIDNLDREIEDELNDPTIQPHHHGRPVGYNSGCKGPLCRKSQRDRMRRPGASATNPWIDEYLVERLEEHKASLAKKNKVA